MVVAQFLFWKCSNFLWYFDRSKHFLIPESYTIILSSAGTPKHDNITLVVFFLKVPKGDNFLLAFFALSDPIWEGDLETKKKNFFCIWPLISIICGLWPHTECAVNQKKMLVRPKLKVGCCCIEAHMCTYNGFFWKILQLWHFNECTQILRRVSFFTAYSVDVEDFLPHTQ
jgi:hypothetical protein